MDVVNKRLTNNQKIFFEKMELYVDRPIYFYGSIQRPDYIKGKSDIDVAIFTNNLSSTIQRLCNFLNLKKSEFKKSIYKIDNHIVYGYKGNYEDVNNNINVEVTIYDEKYQTLILYEHNKCRNFPFYVTIALFIVKFLFYNLNIISAKTYKKCKVFLMNNNELKFIKLDY